MPKTVRERFDLLTPWLNGMYDQKAIDPDGDLWTQADWQPVRRRLRSFISSFDGSAEAGHVVAVPVATEPTDEDLQQLEGRLLLLLEQGFATDADGLQSEAERQRLARELGIQTEQQSLKFPAGSLSFAVRGAGKARALGRYVMEVEGTTTELVLFLVAHLLTQPSMVEVKRCERVGCDHFVVTMTGKRGAPQKFCSPACRDYNRAWIKEQEKQRRADKRRER